jgi:NADH-quinone oxidoreductase subunit G
VTKFQAEVDGPLSGGDPGRRLIELAQDISPVYFDQAPEAFRPDKRKWLIVPLYHIFGSDELSILTPGVAERAPQPYLALHPDDASRLPGDDQSSVELSFDGQVYHLPVRLEPSLPAGVAGLPFGLPGSPAVTLPRQYQLSRELRS